MRRVRGPAPCPAGATPSRKPDCVSICESPRAGPDGPIGTIVTGELLDSSQGPAAASTALAGHSAPDLAGRPREEIELAALIVPRDLVSGRDRGEATLRAQGQVRHWDVPRRLVDPPEQVVLR